MSKIFISYRRDDSAVIAGRIYDYLTPPLGPFEPKHVFKDVDSIPLGVNFKTYLSAKVAECVLSLVIIGPQWTTIRDGDNHRRLDDPRDFVRIEVESALQRNIPVIPLLVMGARMPREDELPDTLRPLVYQNGTPIRNDPDFKTDVARVIRSLTHWLEQPTQSSAQSQTQAQPVIAPAPMPQPRIEIVQPPPAPKEPQAGEMRPDDHGIPMVYVPAGKFLMGSDLKRDEDARDNEKSQHEIIFAQGFWIDQFQVTNAAYEAFIKDGGYENQRL